GLVIRRVAEALLGAYRPDVAGDAAQAERQRIAHEARFDAGAEERGPTRLSRQAQTVIDAVADRSRVGQPGDVGGHAVLAAVRESAHRVDAFPAVGAGLVGRPAG